MAKYPRPTKQFDFIGKRMSKLGSVQRALLRRTDYRGTTFDDGVGAQSKEFSEAMMKGKRVGLLRSGVVTEVHEVVLDWDQAEGHELTGPTYLTLNMDGMDLLRFKVGNDHMFELYSNTRNLLDVRGKIEKIKSIGSDEVESIGSAVESPAAWPVESPSEAVQHELESPVAVESPVLIDPETKQKKSQKLSKAVDIEVRIPKVVPKIGGKIVENRGKVIESGKAKR